MLKPSDGHNRPALCIRIVWETYSSQLESCGREPAEGALDSRRGFDMSAELLIQLLVLILMIIQLSSSKR